MTRLLAAALLIGSLSAADKPEATSRVYVYDIVPAVRMNPIFCDGVKTAQIRRNRFFALTLPAGEHSFSGRHREQQITLDLEAGKTYYLRLDQVFSYPGAYDKLTRQRAEDAGKVINTLGAIDEKDVFDRARVTLERPAAP